VRLKLGFLVLFILSFFLFAISVGVKTTVAVTTDSNSTTTKTLPLIQDKREMIIKNREVSKTMMKDKREDLKEKLRTIKDEKKKLLVERIDEKISTMNKNHTARFSKVLEKLEMILNRITERALDLKSKGTDTLKVDSAVISAKTAIGAAKDKVAMQAAKTYGIEVINETRLRANFGSIVSMFRKDLKDVHKTVVDAKQAVQAAEMELAKARGEQKEDVKK